MKQVLVLTLAAVAVATAVGCGLGGQPGKIVVKRQAFTPAVVARGPKIDGTVKSPLWAKCPALTPGDVQSQQVGQLKTTAHVLLDKENLYVAWVCQEKDTDSLVAGVTDRDGNLWNDDSVELFVNANPQYGFCHFIVNSKGVLLDPRTPPDADEDVAWNSSAVVKTTIQKGRCWVVTLSVPLKELGVKSGKGQTWAFNLNRSKPQPDGGWVESSWSSKGLSRYPDPTGWGKMVNVNIP